MYVNKYCTKYDNEKQIININNHYYKLVDINTIRNIFDRVVYTFITLISTMFLTRKLRMTIFICKKR